jgi:hypothetical protein
MTRLEKRINKAARKLAFNWLLIGLLIGYFVGKFTYAGLDGFGLFIPHFGGFHVSLIN